MANFPYCSLVKSTMKPFSVSCDLLHEKPDVVRFSNLLSKEECQHLIQAAEPFLTRSATFSGKEDSRRTSSSAFSQSGGNDNFFKDPIMQTLIKRCSLLCGIPVEHVEPPQVVRYFPGEKFVAHLDNYDINGPPYKKSGQRIYTFFVYLTDPESDEKEEGGEKSGGDTYFRGLDLSVPALEGSAAFWRNVMMDKGQDDVTDERSFHEGRPPMGWTKWGMNVWFRRKPWY